MTMSESGSATANETGYHFLIQNLPFGIFSTATCWDVAKYAEKCPCSKPD